MAVTEVELTNEQHEVIQKMLTKQTHTVTSIVQLVIQQIIDNEKIVRNFFNDDEAGTSK